MSEELSKEINESIQKNLPQMVSGPLIERLERADRDTERVKSLSERTKVLEKEIDRLHSMLANQEGVESQKRTNEVDKKENEDKALELKHQDHITAIMQRHSDEKVNMMRDVVRDVFANNKFKYSKTGDREVPYTPEIDEYGNQKGYPQSQTLIEKTEIETEG